VIVVYRIWMNTELHTPQPVPIPGKQPPFPWKDMPFPIDEPEDDDEDTPPTKH
jgi:hypothetical protein